MVRESIPEAVFMRQALPIERFIQGLADALHGSLAGSAETGCWQQCDRRRCCMPQRAQTGCKGFKPWFCTAVNIGKYRPADVNVTTEKDCVIIHARREERNGEDFDISEAKRQVKLPEGFDGKKALCFMGPGGRIFVKAPLADETEPRKCPQKQTDPKSGDPTSGADVECADSSTTGRDGGATETEDPETSERSPTVDITVKSDEKPAEREYITCRSISCEREDGDEFTNTDDDVAVTEPDTEESILDYVVDTRNEPSPAPSDDFTVIDDQPINNIAEYIVDTPPETSLTNKDVPETEKTTEDNQDLMPLADSVRVVDEGGKKSFEVSLNLKDYDAESMTVQLVDNELHIGAKKEEREYGVYSLKEINRKYPVPDAGILDAARAQITSSGMVTVTVPLDAEQKDEPRTIPIVQLE